MTDAVIAEPTSLLKQHPEVRSALAAFDTGDFRTAKAQLARLDRAETTAADVDALRTLDRGLGWDWIPVAVGVALVVGWGALYFGAI